jgi:hypothetical protein
MFGLKRKLTVNYTNALKLSAGEDQKKNRHEVIRIENFLS